MEAIAVEADALNAGKSKAADAGKPPLHPSKKKKTVTFSATDEVRTIPATSAVDVVSKSEAVVAEKEDFVNETPSKSEDEDDEDKEFLRKLHSLHDVGEAAPLKVGAAGTAASSVDVLAKLFKGV
jgi:hypothetical protein